MSLKSIEPLSALSTYQQNMLDRLVIVGCCMELTAIISTGERESTYHVQISHHMDLDESSWGWDSVFVGDGEGNEVFPNIVDESLGWFN